VHSDEQSKIHNLNKLFRGRGLYACRALPYSNPLTQMHLYWPVLRANSLHTEGGTHKIVRVYAASTRGTFQCLSEVCSGVKLNGWLRGYLIMVMLGTRVTLQDERGRHLQTVSAAVSDRSPCQLPFPSPHKSQASSPESRPYAEHPGSLLTREVGEVGNKRRGAVFMLT